MTMMFVWASVPRAEARIPGALSFWQLCMTIMLHDLLLLLLDMGMPMVLQD